MTETPARDALAEALRLKPDGTSIRDIMRHPDLVLAALVESGWRPTDPQDWFPLYTLTERTDP